MYSDVTKNHWAYNNIKWATNLKVMVGYNIGTEAAPEMVFKPDQAVTRAELATVAMRLLGLSLLTTGVGLAGYAYFTRPVVKKVS